MRKYLFSPSIWSSLFGIVGVAKSTASGPRDWRLILQWVVLGATIALAFDAVNQRSQEAEDY